MANEQPQVVRDGPWRRLRDQQNPNTRIKAALSKCRNMVPDATGRLIWRPGQRTITAAASLSGSNPGFPVQLLYQFNRKNGNRYTIGISFGRFFTYDWTAGSWTEVLTTAELTAAAITLDTQKRVTATTFADKVIISDGVNTPWAWDGTAHAGLTKLTNAPVFYGAMTQYYGRIFGIKASDRTTIVWSEVLQPNTGYEAGFANAWTVAQTNTNLLNAIYGTNDALYVFRAYSITSLTGRPDTNFASTATREGVDEEIGSSSPFAVVPSGKGLLFLDSSYRPQLLRPGASLIPAWEDLAETIDPFDDSIAVSIDGLTSRGRATGLSIGDLAIFAVQRPATGGILLDMLLVYDTRPDVPVAVATWDSPRPIMAGAVDPWAPTAWAVVEDGNGTPRLMHGSAGGYVFVHGNPREDFYKLSGSTNPVYDLPIVHEITTMPLTFDEKKEWIFDRVDISFTEILAPCTAWISVETPRGRSIWKSFRLKAGGARFNVDRWQLDDTAPNELTASRWGRPGGEIKKSIGIDARGRWVKIHLMHRATSPADGVDYDPEYSGDFFGVNQLSVTCYESGDDPEAP